jgi:hypothetical protein
LGIEVVHFLIWDNCGGITAWLHKSAYGHLLGLCYSLLSNLLSNPLRKMKGGVNYLGGCCLKLSDKMYLFIWYGKLR